MSIRHDASAPLFIWSNAAGTGRNQFVLFRRDFDLTALPSKAILHLFADSRYRLRVNGEIIGYGPARFVPAFPEYDSHDVTPFLRPGRNAVTVEVNHYGASSFQTMPGTTGGFIVWGIFGEIDFATPGEWKTLSLTAWDADAPPFSFAQGPVEILDTRQQREEWFSPEFDASVWPAAVTLADQSVWGQLTPCAFALPVGPIEGATLLHTRALTDDETRLSFRVRTTDSHRLRRDGKEPERIVYAVFLHSSHKQEAEIGLFWGPHYLNGVELPNRNDERRGNRRNVTAKLHAGWNLLYGEIETFQDVWGMLIGLPKSANLTARACPDLAEPAALRHTLPIPASALNAVPANAARLDALSLEWHYLLPDNLPALPAREFAWDIPANAATESANESGAALTIVWDFGGEYLGHIRLEVDGPPGTIYDLAYDERLRPDGLIALFATNPFVDSVDRYIGRGGPQIIEGFPSRGGRYIQVTVRQPVLGVGYWVLGSRPTPNTQYPTPSVSVSVRSAKYPFSAEGDFHCDDDLFNWTEKTGVATVRACAEDSYLDCPWRERGLYGGDLLVEMPVQLSFCADSRLARRCLRLFAQGQRSDGLLQAVVPAWHQLPHCDFTLLWILALRDYQNRTGDPSLTPEVWPAVERIWDSPAWQSGPSGLWNTAGLNPFIDWGISEATRHSDENGCLNILRFAALQASADLAETLGKTHEAETFRAKAETLRGILQDLLYLPTEGMYAAGASREPSPHATALALTFGVASEAQTNPLLASLITLLHGNVAAARAGNAPHGHLELYFLHFVLTALYRQDKAAEAEEIIRTHYAPLRDADAWTLWETLREGLHGKGSLCHGWSAAPLLVFRERILGIRPAVLGRFDAFIIAPCAETIDRASGEIPLPGGGIIQINWQVEGDALRLRVIAPEGVSWKAQPQGRLGRLTLRQE